MHEKDQGDGLRTVREWLAARSRRDIDTVAALTHEDATWESPVDGVVRGRAAVAEQVRAGWTDTEAFSSGVIRLETRGDDVVALVRNRGRRDGDELDSLQALVFRVRAGLVAEVRVHVDDPEAVQEFWADEAT